MTRGGTESGWRPLREPHRGPEAFVTTPFTRLARVHALAVASDTFVAMALAGSLFFSIPTGDARGRVALYLLLTMAPFAVIAPLIGPAIDRTQGGRRLIVVVSLALRAVVFAFMINHVDSLLLFPEAFLVLVLSKTYMVTKSALVPTVVDTDEDLVLANSKLSLLSGVVGLVAAIPGIVALQVGGPEWVLALGILTSTAGALLATRMPATAVAPAPPGPAEEAELRSTGIVLAASAMGLLRGLVGFLTFLLAFDLRGGGDDTAMPAGLAAGRALREAAGLSVSDPGGGGHPAWHFGFVLGASVLGSLAGAALAPRLRQSVSEERILTGALAATVAGALLATLQGGLGGAAVIALVVGIAASAGKLAFDSLVQRDAPDANRGRSFARFETRFQLVWVVGAFIPVALPLPARFGYLSVAGAAGFAVFSYAAGQRGYSTGRSMRASQSPGASTSLGVGSSDSTRQSLRNPSPPARSITPETNDVPRS